CAARASRHAIAATSASTSVSEASARESAASENMNAIRRARMFANWIQGKLLGAIVGLLLLVVASPVGADETCNSPYMGNLIKRKEDYLYVWAPGGTRMG